MKNTSHFYLSANFLRLAYETAIEIVNSGNPATINSPISTSEFNQKIRWTDHSVGIAAIFCFYHGIELMMKGFILEKGGKAEGHKLTQLLTKFESCYPDSPLSKELRQNIVITGVNTPLSDFLSTNQIQIDQWYEALKYPEMKNGTTIDHFPIKYKGKSGTDFWRNIAEASASIHNLAKSFLN